MATSNIASTGLPARKGRRPAEPAPLSLDEMRKAVFALGHKAGFLWIREHLLQNGKYAVLSEIPEDDLRERFPAIMASGKSSIAEDAP